MAIVEYKCPNCTAPISFDSSLQKCQCPFCETIIDIEEMKKQLLDIDVEEKEETQPEYYRDDGLTVYTCKSCGGEIIGDANMAATSCPFCNNNVIISSKLSGMLKPDLVIPFKYNKQQAVDALSNHVKGKKLLPKVFKDENHIQEIKGIYVPYWLYSGETKSSYELSGTRSSTWSDSNYNYTKTDFYQLYRAGTLGFHDIPADGSSKMDDTLMESIEPFNLEDAKPFDPAYLTGYFADKYDVEKDDNLPRIKQRMQESTKNAIYNSVSGYMSVTEKNAQTSISKMRIQYAFYPVWILTTTWKGENYMFAMNGQTGKFVGNLPMDKSLWTKYFILYGIIFSIIVYLAIFLYVRVF